MYYAPTLSFTGNLEGILKDCYFLLFFNLIKIKYLSNDDNKVNIKDGNEDISNILKKKNIVKNKWEEKKRNDKKLKSWKKEKKCKKGQIKKET